METFTTRRPIRMSDADIYGNVHNLSIIQYAEDTAIEWVWALRDELGIQTYWGTANVQAGFSKPLPWTLAEVRLTLRAEKVGRASLTLATTISSDRGEHATVRARYVRFDPTGSRSVMSPEERGWYARYLVPDTLPTDRVLAGVNG
ncbi:acyl-CoA thioesterase [Streptomyces liangshanensis]|uniref:Acyl-CoA thioesterase n=1 Tax=Streptomyces liangshanensis TaxID=2717324 RepID=A0A6G9H4U0_9ACTN|nr:acyl-CoA thioesterase [Streptomyces liangshanensis]QIQ05500.1 acyl-CoA thioesterase [Streptomyces liangshanensis]